MGLDQEGDSTSPGDWTERSGVRSAQFGAKRQGSQRCNFDHSARIRKNYWRNFRQDTSKPTSQG